MTTHQSTLASVGEALERVLARYQINADALFLEAGITDVDRRTLDARIPIDKLHDFWARAVAATRNRCIGFEAGQAIYSTNLASLGYAWLSSATLRQGIHRLARYHRILSTGLTIIVDEQPGRVTLTVERHPDTPIQGRDACMCLVVTLCREVANPEFAPMHVCLSGPRPPCAEELMRFFACDVEFDADVDEIAVSAASADEPLPRASATMARLSDQAAQSYLAALDRDDVVSRVRVAILEQLPEGEPSRREAAARVAVSERTLARRLAAEGTSFKRILNDVRTELAQAYLTEPRRSVTETAFLLGFNDQANFARAFKRWTGQSPTAYRTSHV